jgi:hypothetical protein
MAALLENLCRYQDEGESFVESFVTGNETWNSLTLERSSFTNYKKNSKLGLLQKKQWQPHSEIVKASCCMNCLHKKQQSTVTNGSRLSKNCVKLLNE